MFCSKCGSEVPDESQFCSTCGAQFPWPHSAQPDAELEALAATGDREAFAELYERHFDRVYDFLRRLLRDADEAADLTQETFLRAMRALSPKEKKAAFSTWLFTIARNLALKRLERRRRIAAEPEQQGDEEEPIVYRQVDTDRFADPQEAAQAQELSGLVWQAAAGLNPKEYSLLDLHVRQGLESAEIAHVLGVSKGNAYTMMSRLKDTLESAVAALQLLQLGRKECDGLNRLLEEQRITLISPDARRLIDRHVGQCATCQEQRRRLVSPAAIFGSFAAVPVPFGLKPRIAEAVMGSWAEAGSEAVGGIKGLLSQAATKVGSLPTAWKAAIIAGLLVGAVGGGLGGWIGVGGGAPLFGDGGESSAMPQAALVPSPTLSPTPARTPTVEPTPTATPSDTEFTELIAYIGTDGNVWTVRPDGSNRRQVTTNGDNAQPAWSPDGSTMAYIHSRREVYLANADGTDERQVPLRDHCAEPFGRYGLGAARLTRVQFTPDGQGVRLGIDWGGITNQFICHLPLDAATPALPTVNGDEFGVNPKGGVVAFTQSGQGCAWMYIVDADGGNRREIGPTMGRRCAIEPEELSVLPYAPTWSPDGETIAFYGVDGARTSRVYTLDPSDAASAQLMVEAGQVQDLQGGVLGLAWSPDGEFLAYEKDGGVWVLEMATGATRKLVDGTNPAWGRVPAEPVPAPTTTPTPEPDISLPKPASCPVGDASFCDFVYDIDAALATRDISFIVAHTGFAKHLCSDFNLEGPALQGLIPPIGCDAQTPDKLVECVNWRWLGGARPYNTCLTKEEYVQALSSVPYTPTEASLSAAVIGISFGCPDPGCQGTLFLRDPTKPLSGDPQFDNGVLLTAVQRDVGWVIRDAGCCLAFLYGGYAEFSWPPE